jgi:hypothetical protein
VFDRLRYRRDDRRVFLYAWRRKVLLMRLLAKAPVGLQINDHIVEPGDVVFRHACQLGFEGTKNPAAPAVKRRVEDDAAKHFEAGDVLAC